MNLSTHTAYQEIDINEHNVFTVKLIERDGTVVFDDMGAGVDRKDAKKRALELIAKEEPAYRKGE